MGLGKTVATLTAFEYLRSQFLAHRMLVVGPLRVARRVWRDEVLRWDHLKHLTVATAVGTVNTRANALNAGADITTINRENCQWMEDFYIEGRHQVREFPFDMVVLDESQSFKSQSSYRWKAMKRLRRLFPRCVLLTGTPIPNGYGDLWSQVYLLDQGERLGHSELAFHNRWFNPPPWETYDWTLKPTAPPEIQQAISDITLTMRAEDYITLPPVRFNRIYVDMPIECVFKYKRLAKKYILETDSGAIVTAANAAVVTGKLAQLANGIAYLEDGTYEVLHEAKIDALVELLEGLPKPVMVAYGFVADSDRIFKAVSKLAGTTSRLVSDKDMDRFKAGEIDYGVLHPASTGHGLNDMHLSGCKNIVWFGLTNNLEYWLQLNARITGGLRRGEGVAVHMILTSDTVDSQLLNLLQAKDATENDLTSKMGELAKAAL